MNSVMDDNKLLTLPNGERIRLAPHVKLLFEVADLQYASPATISRREGVALFATRGLLKARATNCVACFTGWGAPWVVGRWGSSIMRLHHPMHHLAKGSSHRIARALPPAPTQMRHGLCRQP